MPKVIFIVVIAVILIVFLSESGILHSSSFSFLKSIFSTSTFPGYGIPGGSSSTIRAGGGVGETPAINPEDIPPGFPKNLISPHFHEVRITQVSPVQSNTPNTYETVVLTANTNKASIGGWILASNRGHEFIPPAISKLNPSVPAIVQDIVLKNGETLTLYSSLSPLNANFRINKCTGYLNNTYHFDPPLPQECPMVNQRDITTFTGACQDYLLSIGSCQSSAPGYLIPNYDYACRAYVQRLNYQGCVNAHRADADFLGSAWLAWTGHRFMDPLHDQILLFDANAKLVDRYVY